MKNFKIALCQMNVVDNKKLNIDNAVQMIGTAAKNGADIIALPEMFNCIYNIMKFRENSEDIDGETVRSISNAAKENGVYVVAGSIPERYENSIYNTSFMFDRKGNVIGKYRKIHLFDINSPGKMVFKESIAISPGNDITVVDTEFCKIGIVICYDVRFPELLRLNALAGAKLIVIPAAFNMVTGPAHWNDLMKVRAVDNQVYIAAVSPARDEKSSYIAYGNSMLVEPWGSIVAKAEEGEEIVYGVVDLEHLEKVRNELPLLRNRRTDVY